MNIQITTATESHIPEMIRLMNDFAEYEGLKPHCTVTAEKLRSALFGAGAAVRGLIALDGTRVLGYALFYRSFASFRGQRGFFLEDLYVDRQYRGKGVGREILRVLAASAKQEGAERIDFLVLERNGLAIAFYESLGAERGEPERHYKFAGAAFEGLAG